MLISISFFQNKDKDGKIVEQDVLGFPAELFTEGSVAPGHMEIDRKLKIFEEG
jgi:hypothetical protein